MLGWPIEQLLTRLLFCDTEREMISGFRDRRTAAVFVGKVLKGFPVGIANSARLKLRMLDVARSLADLRSPPSNRLEALRGDRAGQHSIRVNDQWRVCFRWHDGNAFDVEIVDYH
jgi:toxin HigB-1